MNPALWITIYMPIFILLFIIIPNERKASLMAKRRKKGGGDKMNNELLAKYKGRKCILYTGSFGSTVQGQILDVVDNWVEVKTKKQIKIINAEYITTVTIEEDK